MPTSNSPKPRNPQQRLPLHVKPPTEAQTTAFAAWYENHFGVRLEPIEAAARLQHIAELFLLLGGAEWLQARRAAQSQDALPPPHSPK